MPASTQKICGIAHGSRALTGRRQGPRRSTDAPDVSPSGNEDPMSDPLMPAAHRFPMNPITIPLTMAQPSADRPFVLRGLLSTPDHAVDARHRTPRTQRTIPRRTNLDSKIVEDSYTVPDE